MTTLTVSTNIAGLSAFVPIDLRKLQPQGAGMLFNVPTGVTVLATVEVTGVPSEQISTTPTPYVPNAGRWNSHDVLVAMTASKNSSLQYPVTGVRLNVASISGGTVTLDIVLIERP